MQAYRFHEELPRDTGTLEGYVRFIIILGFSAGMTDSPKTELRFCCTMSLSRLVARRPYEIDNTTDAAKLPVLFSLLGRSLVTVNIQLQLFAVVRCVF